MENIEFAKLWSQQLKFDFHVEYIAAATLISDAVYISLSTKQAKVSKKTMGGGSFDRWPIDPNSIFF